MNKKVFLIIWRWLFVTMLLSACAAGSPASAPVQAVEPPSMNDLGTFIAKTAAAAQTQTATFLPSPTFTLTPSVTPTVPTPSPTFFFSILSQTPAVPIETTNAELGVENSGFALSINTPDPVPYSGKPWTCVGAGKFPPNSYTGLPAGKPFIASWTVINTGTKDWTANTIDFVYKSGYRHEGKIIQDLDRFVPSGKKATLRVQFTAPKAPGGYSAVWTLKVGNNTFCGMAIFFEIKD